MKREALPPQWDVWLAFGLTALLFMAAHGYALGDPYIVNDDTRQQLFWMQQWCEPGLYPDSWLADYSRRYVTWGVQGVYRLAATVMPPLEFSKYLTGLEFMALGGMLFLLGRGLGGRAAGWAVLGLFWLSPFFLHTMSGGLARSFGAPLMALFWLSWQQGTQEGRWRQLARSGLLVSLLLLGLFLPYIWALCGLALGLAWIWGRVRPAQAPPAPQLWRDYLIVAVSALPVFLYNQELAGSGFGPMVSEAQMQVDPVFGPLGRFPIVPVPSLFFELLARPLERLLPFREAGPVIGGLVALAAGWLVWSGGRRVAWRTLLPRLRPFFFLLAASLLLWVAARVLLLALFIPSRYLEYTSNLFWVVLPGVLVGALLQKWFAGKKWLAAFAVLVVLGAAGWRLHGEALHDYGDDAALYAAVRETGKDALFAGHPYAMDNVLTFGQRKALATYELAHPWSQGLWRRLRPRLEDMLAAYYTRDPQAVRDFCQTWDVDYIVLHETHFSRAFMLPGRQLVPVCQAPMPDLAHTVCRALGLRFPVTIHLGARQEFPSDHPMFAPYGERIARLARGKRDFALLDRTVFPGSEVSPGVWLLDMRSQGPNAGEQSQRSRE